MNAGAPGPDEQSEHREPSLTVGLGAAEERVGHREPSPWVTRYATLIPALGPILDVAGGRGRHSWFFLEQGRSVVVVDRDLSAMSDLLDHPNLEAVHADLEDGRPFPLLGRLFAGVICTNYLHRPLLPSLVAAVAPGGVLLYETFTEGHQRLGRPQRPEFLLRPGELLAAVAGRLTVAAHEEVLVRRPQPALVQRIAAVRPSGAAAVVGQQHPLLTAEAQH